MQKVAAMIVVDYREEKLAERNTHYRAVCKAT